MVTSLINCSILECSIKLNCLMLSSGLFFFKISSFSDFVPVPKTLPPKEINLFTNDPPIPPVAPVIKFFYFKINHLRLLISSIEFILLTLDFH